MESLFASFLSGILTFSFIFLFFAILFQLLNFGFDAETEKNIVVMTTSATQAKAEEKWQQAETPQKMEMAEGGGGAAELSEEKSQMPEEMQAVNEKSIQIFDWRIDENFSSH